MKRLFNYIFVIIAAMVTFAGCEMSIIDESLAPETKTVQFYANSIETKTAFGTPDGNTYPTLWSEGDKVKVFLNLYPVQSVTTEDVVEVQPSGDFRTATFKSNDIGNPADTDKYTFYAVSPSTAYISGSRDADNNCFVVSIPKTQKPTVASVDPAAQVIYAASSTVDAFPTSVDLSFKHFTAYCKLSFLNIDNTLGNDIKSVTVQSDGLNFVGEWKLGLDGNHIPNSETDNDAIHITTNSTENIWFACAPVDVRGKSITFIVETKEGTATRTVQFPNEDKYQFKSGAIANLKVNMSDAEISKPETVQYFTKVETAPTDWSGTYLIVYETGKVAFNGNLSTLDAVSNTVPVTIENNKIQYTELLAKSTFVISKSGDSYSVKSASGYYIGNTSNSNALKQNNSTEYTHIISLANGDVSLTESNNTTLKFNNASNQMRFRYYKSGQQNIQLYILDGSGSEGGEGGETPEPELQERNLQFSETTTTATVGEEFTEPTLTGAADDVTYSSSNTNVATVNETTGEVTLVAAGETTITASAASDETYKAGEASYTLTVSAGSQGGGDVADPVTVIATIGDLGWNDATKYTTLTLDDVITATASSGTNTGKYYNSDLTWRFYANESAKLTIKAEDGYIIKTVKLTYTIKDYGTLNSGSDALSSDKTYDVNSASVTYTVGSSSGSKGKVFIKTIEVVYQAN